jgi:hypothetical protein
MGSIVELIRDLLIFVVVMFVLLIALIVVVSMLPADNPLKRILTALCYRVGATVAAGAIAIPIEPIPGLDFLYDVGIPILLLLFWLSFFRDAARIISESSSIPSLRGRTSRLIEHKDQ